MLELVKSNRNLSEFHIELIDTFIFSISSNEDFSLKLINYNESYLEIAEEFAKKINNGMTVCFILYPEYINSMDYISKSIWNGFPELCMKIREVLFYDTISEKNEDDNYDFVELCEVLKLFPNLEMLYLNCYCREETWECIIDTLSSLKEIRYLNTSSRVSDDFDFFSYECSIKILEGIKNSKNLLSLIMKGKFNERFFEKLVQTSKQLRNLSKIILSGIIDITDNVLETYIKIINDITPHISIVIKKI